ncbi:TRAP transporter substrate-binding protein [Caminibacter mediatlanticus TB-2]|uniref:TRAP transporter substrate-binding protein n=1 Tax=Caminibacter mediatlanticus TB-2 TaxID=391592 RepID=A0ABX5V6W0_9BACT|nr:TRAP transporter substrate-binding protein [Caminibacter mediatlanticus]QCT94007.1 TRAP transporter substrate-binding protein [Caminibacter mediatlanticus TB-2]
MLKKITATLTLIGSLFASTMTLDMNCVYGLNNFHTKGAQKFAKLVEKYSNGTIKIKVHSGNSLVKGNPLKAVKNAVVPISDMFLPFTSGGGKVFGISALPFIAKSYDDAYRLYQISKPAYEKVFQKWNQKFLYAVSWPPSGLYTKWAVKSLKDFKGLKVRTYDKNSANFVKMAGGSAVALPWAEVYSALRTGLVNGVVTSSVSGKDGKFWEVLSHFTKINYAYPLQGVSINLDYWKSLNPMQQKAILKAAKEIEAIQWKVSKEEDKKALYTLKAHRMVVSEATPELKKELDKIADKMLKEYLNGAPYNVKEIFKKYKQ